MDFSAGDIAPGGEGFLAEAASGAVEEGDEFHVEAEAEGFEVGADAGVAVAADEFQAALGIVNRDAGEVR